MASIPLATDTGAEIVVATASELDELMATDTLMTIACIATATSEAETSSVSCIATATSEAETSSVSSITTATSEAETSSVSAAVSDTPAPYTASIHYSSPMQICEVGDALTTEASQVTETADTNVLLTASQVTETADDCHNYNVPEPFSVVKQVQPITVGAEFESWDEFLEACQVHCDRTFQPLRLTKTHLIESVNKKNTMGNRPTVQYNPQWVYRVASLECMYGRKYMKRNNGAVKDCCQARIYASIDRVKDKIIVQTVSSKHNHQLYKHNGAKIFIPGLTDRKRIHGAYNITPSPPIATQITTIKKEESTDFQEELKYEAAGDVTLDHDELVTMDQDEEAMLSAEVDLDPDYEDDEDNDETTPARNTTVTHTFSELQSEITNLLSKNSSQMQTLLTTSATDDASSAAKTSRVISKVFGNLKSQIHQLLSNCVDGSKNETIISKLMSSIDKVLTEREKGLQDHFKFRSFVQEEVDEQAELGKRQEKVKGEPWRMKVPIRNRSEKIFECTLCELLFPTEYKLQKHRAEAHFGRYIHCSECKRVFCSNALKKKHMKETGHKGESPQVWECDQCEMSFRNSNSFTRHVHSAHASVQHAKGRAAESKKKTKIYKKPEKKFHVCQHCGRSFSSITSLRIHVAMVHTGEKIEYKCGQCPETFSTQNLLNKHIRGPIHAESRKWICTQCGKSFIRSTDLKNHCYRYHIKTATTTQEKINQLGKGPFTCEYCQKVYLSKDAFKHHVQYKHTGDIQPIPCPHCKHTFSSKYYLNEHTVKYHGGKKPYECSVCGKGFWVQATLTIHINKEHLNDAEQRIAVQALEPIGRPEDAAIVEYEQSVKAQEAIIQYETDNALAEDKLDNYVQGMTGHVTVTEATPVVEYQAGDHVVQLEGSLGQQIGTIGTIGTVVHLDEQGTVVTLDEEGISASQILNSMVHA